MCEFTDVRFAATNSLKAMTGLGYKCEVKILNSRLSSRLNRGPFQKTASVTLAENRALPELCVTVWKWHAAVLHVAILLARKRPLEHRKISAPDSGPSRHAAFDPYPPLDVKPHGVCFTANSRPC
jgi:hypothetical protein